jgi:hypothetical protein
MKKLLFALSLLAFGLSACHDHDDNDSVKPTLTITAPTNAASFTSGSEVKITGKLSDEKSLHELKIIVTQVSDGKELFKAEPTVHDLSNYDINETWKPNVSADTPVKLTVTAEDHGSNKTEVTVNFTVKK